MSVNRNVTVPPGRSLTAGRIPRPCPKRQWRWSRATGLCSGSGCGRIAPCCCGGLWSGRGAHRDARRCVSSRGSRFSLLRGNGGSVGRGRRWQRERHAPSGFRGRRRGHLGFGGSAPLARGRSRRIISLRRGTLGPGRLAPCRRGPASLGGDSPPDTRRELLRSSGVAPPQHRTGRASLLALAGCADHALAERGLLQVGKREPRRLRQLPRQADLRLLARHRKGRRSIRSDGMCTSTPSAPASGSG